MKLVWHIVSKDAVKLWPTVGLWAVLFTLHLFSQWRVAHPGSDDPEMLARLKFFELLFSVVQLLTGYVFTAILVQEDSPVGTSTFWSTRPISGARLLLAKSVFCFLWFFVAATLLSLPWWLSAGADGTQLVSGIAKLLRGHAWMVGAAFVIAAFTDSMAKFLGWTLGVVLTLLAILLIFFERRVVTIESPAWLAVAVTVALWIHYQRRREFLALLVITFAGVSSLVVAFVSTSLR